MPKSKNFDYCCHVCGRDQGFEPWGKDKETPTFDICPCCGVQFGYEDFTLEGTKEFREDWLATGAKWFDPEFKPTHWSLEEQMKNIPPEFK